MRCVKDIFTRRWDRQSKMCDWREIKSSCAVHQRARFFLSAIFGIVPMRCNRGTVSQSPKRHSRCIRNKNICALKLSILKINRHGRTHTRCHRKHVYKFKRGDREGRPYKFISSLCPNPRVLSIHRNQRAAILYISMTPSVACALPNASTDASHCRTNGNLSM